MKEFIIAGIGELLWDMLPTGKQLGGAPCNFVYHAQRLGAKGITVSAVGEDASGKEIRETLQKKGLSTAYIQQNSYPTSTVDIVLDDKGVPNYIIHEEVAWDFIEYTDAVDEMIAEADAVCFGSLAQRNSISRLAIKAALGRCKPECLKIFDINLRQHYYSKEEIESSLQVSNILKLNEDELPVVCDLLKIEGTDHLEQLRALIAKYHLKLIAYTLGANGSYLVSSQEDSFMPTPKVEVKDTVGAGDAFTAAMTVGLLQNKSLKEIHRNAVELSAFVCTQNGAMPE
ncbi:MAG: Fructokinase [Candidatus Ordinivivax streblomastigis]|uniref:Fructokinase n=1 Tax=Candidatus Ordinivivax streblomastigis TaxID=2540710 RepID=A0A5M8NZD1_9BACT|nr:MAG: Fructokinase [Candidatus Ordinivivax streblomastigis]